MKAFIAALVLGFSSFGLDYSVAAEATLPLNHPGYGEGIDQAMSICTGLEQPHLRDRCRKVVSQARFFVPAALHVCQQVTFAPSLVECVEVVADQPYRDSEARSCQVEDNDRRKIDCLKSMRQPSNPIGQPGYDQISRSYVRQQIRSALDMMDLGNFYLARQILTSLLFELDRGSRSARRP